MPLKLPDGAEARFQVISTGPFGETFATHLWGAGRRGWYHSILRGHSADDDTGPMPLAKGEWRTFLNLIKQARFWELPEVWPDPWPENVTVDDGSHLGVAGRDRERYHHLCRFVWREPVLDQLLMFCVRRSGFYELRPGRSGWWLRSADVVPSTPVDPLPDR